jgi:hypothetical protein
MVGAQASEEQLHKILGYIDIGRPRARSADRRHATGPRGWRAICAADGVVGNNQMRIFQEEIFGPVLSVTTFKDGRGGARIANDTPTALARACGPATATPPTARPRDPGRAGLDQLLSRLSRPCGVRRLQASGIGRENHRMMLDHYQQTKNLLVSYDQKLGFFDRGQGGDRPRADPAILKGETDMAKTMKAAVVREFGKPLVIEEAPIPTVGPGQIQVAIQATACATDLHAAEGDWPVKPNRPSFRAMRASACRRGRQGVTHVKEGDRVGVPWLYTACGHCVHCLGGWGRFATNSRTPAIRSMAALPNMSSPIPTMSVTFPPMSTSRHCAVLCAGVTVYKGLKATDTKPGEWVVVSGIGGLGHMAVQYVAMGLNVAAVDIDDSKLDLATPLGAN